MPAWLESWQHLNVILQATLFFELAKLQDKSEKEGVEDYQSLRLTHAQIQDCIAAVNNQVNGLQDNWSGFVYNCSSRINL